MKEKKITNPLSVIGVFAGISQITITCFVNFVDMEVKIYFTYFAIGFPVLLTLMFFITLLWKPSVLYSPGDYKNEQNFLRSLGILNKQNKVRKIVIKGEK